MIVKIQLFPLYQGWGGLSCWTRTTFWLVWKTEHKFFFLTSLWTDKKHLNQSQHHLCWGTIYLKIKPITNSFSQRPLLSSYLFTYGYIFELHSLIYWWEDNKVESRWAQMKTFAQNFITQLFGNIIVFNTHLIWLKNKINDFKSAFSNIINYILIILHSFDWSLLNEENNKAKATIPRITRNINPPKPPIFIPLAIFVMRVLKF